MYNIEKALESLRTGQEKRGFNQSIDLIVTLKGVDLKKPDSKFSEDLILPNGRGTDANVVVFSDNIKGLDCKVLTSGDIQKLTTNKRMIRQLANDTEFFLAETQLMPLIGKSLGQILSPRNKMPKLLTSDPSSMVRNYKKSVKVVVKSAPVIQCFVGKQDMDEKKVSENIETILKFLEGKLKNGRQNIGKILVKYTMSKPVKVEVK